MRARVPGAGSGSAWTWAGLVVLASLVTYAPTWTAPFAEDDFVYLDALAHADPGRLARHFWSEGVMDHHYRPLSDPLVFLFLPSPAAYHALLQGLHAGAACLVLVLGLALGIPRGGAALGALLYATRDALFPSMVWASGITDLGSTFFALAALAAHAAWLRTRRLEPRAGSVLVLAGALLFKETAIVVLALLPLVDLLGPGDRSTIAGEVDPVPAAPRGWLRRAATALARIWPHLVVGLPIAAVQVAFARFDESYGRELYALSAGPHSLARWPVYWAWSLLGVREIESSPSARLGVTLVVASALVALAMALGRVRRRSPEPLPAAGLGAVGLSPTAMAAGLGVAWFTGAILPALLAPNRVLTNYVALASVGPCLALGMLLGAALRHGRPLVRATAWTGAALLLLAGPALVLAKAAGRIAPGGWVDVAEARRTAAALDTLATRVLPDPPPGGLLVVFARPSARLVVLANPDGAGFGERRFLDSAVRWRYGRSDLGTVVVPTLDESPDGILEKVRGLVASFPDRVRVVDLSTTVRDLTPAARRAVERGASVDELRAALLFG